MEENDICDLVNHLREVRDQLHSDADKLRDAANVLEEGMYRRYKSKKEEVDP
ncbi:unnamed protein product, partial [marine sediment metagenome]